MVILLVINMVGPNWFIPFNHIAEKIRWLQKLKMGWPQFRDIIQIHFLIMKSKCH